MNSAQQFRAAALLVVLFFLPDARGQEPSLALGKPVEASGPIWPGFNAASLTDGDPNSIAHPQAGLGTLGYYFEIDLEGTFLLDRIELRNRADGCCPERLSKYGVEIYSDNGGESGQLVWSATIREDGSNSGTSGIDVITGANSSIGVFAGRFIRIVNRSNVGYSPQVAEVEVYGAKLPKILFFDVARDTLSAGESSTLTWQVSGATSVDISPLPGAVALSGSATIDPSVTTTYTISAANEAGVVSANVTVGVDVTLLPPRINEFMAENTRTLKDEDGDYSDWIEIENPNDFGLEAGDFFLTDAPATPQLWRFPEVRIPRRGFLVVFASGKNRRDPAGELHTNFRLDVDGEYLALCDTNRNIIQQFPSTYPSPRNFPQQSKDASYGFGTNGLGFFRAATPGTANGIAFAGLVADLRFGAQRGFYDSGFALALSCDTPGVTIRYTTNYSTPTATAGKIYVYGNPIPVTKTLVVRAAAFRDGWSPTDPVTHSYIFPSNVIAAPNMNTAITKSSVYGPKMRDGLLDVPSVSITTTETINGGAEVKTAIEWLNPSGVSGFQVDCGIRYFGGAFSDFAKKNFRLYFRNEWGVSKLRYPLFAGFDHGVAPVDEFDQLELRGGSHDMEMRGFYMANIFTDDTMLEMGHLNPHGRFVHVYLNGTYLGLFHLRERWGAAMHEEYLGGAKENYESINGNWNVGGWAEPGSPYDGDGSVWTYIKNNRASYAALRPWVDVPEYVDYMLMWMFGGAETEYRAVGPNVPGSGFKFYLNDADGWFCGPYYCAAGNNTVAGAPGRDLGDGPGSIFSMLVKEGHPDYRALLADHIYKSMFNGGPLTVERNKARLIARCQEIERAFLVESARWNYLSPAEWAARRDYALNNWLPQRTAEAFNQYRTAGFYPSLAAPSFNKQGGMVSNGFVVTFTAPAASIYYTTNGTDPRLVGNAVSPDARLFSNGSQTERLVSTGARWRWFTDATGLGSSAIVAGTPGWSEANWKHPTFGDDAWAESAAQFGYGENDEATQIPFGPDPNRKWVTSYYRRTFFVNDPASLTNLMIRLKRDDGAIVYINGREAGRSGITTGAVIGSTFADPASDDGQVFIEIPVGLDFLNDGVNMIAVEVHQATFSSSDLSFDLELVGARVSENPQLGALIIDRNTLVRARAKDGDTWSALNEAFFQVTPSEVTSNNLVIAELNFLPAERDGSEFLELKNYSEQAIDLRGVRFTQGINFLFPTNRAEFLAPGQRLVLVKDLFRFQRRYGIDVPVRGIYSGGLSAAGEQINLLNATFRPIASFRYEAASPWDVTEGYSLVLSDPLLSQSNPAAWHSSATIGGTPGWTDETNFTGDPQIDADGDGFPALLEYTLGTSDLEQGDLTAGFDNHGNFTLTITRNLRANDVRIVPEFSSDLIHWMPGALLSNTNLGAGLASMAFGLPVAGRPIMFARLRVDRIY